MKQILLLTTFILFVCGCVKERIPKSSVAQGFRCEQIGVGALTAKLEFLGEQGLPDRQFVNLKLDTPKYSMEIPEMLLSRDQDIYTLREGMVVRLDAEGQPTNSKIFVGDLSHAIMTMNATSMQAQLNLDMINEILEENVLFDFDAENTKKGNTLSLNCTEL